MPNALPFTLTACKQPARGYAARITSLALALLPFAATPQAQAQSTPTEAQTAYRATSRLGYGPSQSVALADAGQGKAWAARQIEAAFTASQTAPNIAPEQAAINAPLRDIVKGFYTEREARKVLPASAAMTANANVAEATPTMAGTGSTTGSATAKSPLDFSRDMQRAAAVWRLTACSDPALEPPLLAKITEFWFNHLNVFVGKGPVRPFVGHYVINVARAHALGKFEDLLLASAKHPAMLFYLDQVQSNSRGLNENYARELLELHTLGVSGGYSQGDVRELARMLTGWSVNLAQSDGFRFYPRLHDDGSKQLLGVTYPEKGSVSGIEEGEAAIRALARHPATAQRIAQRLAQTFVADQPTPALVSALAQVFLATGGDIKAVMQRLVASPDFWATDHTLIKTPLDYACSALTAVGGIKDPKDVNQSLGFLAQAGQPMHGWQTPDGYQTNEATWLAPEALTRRADYAFGLAQRATLPSHLLPYLSEKAQTTLTRAPEAMRTGLLLASPDFMRK